MALPKDKKNIVQRRHYEYKKKKEYKRKQSIWFRYSSATTYTIATWRMRTMAHIYRHDIYDLCVDMLYCFQTASVLVFIMTNATKRMPRFKGTVPPFLRPRSTTLKLLASRCVVQSFIHGMNNKSSKSGSKKIIINKSEKKRSRCRQLFFFLGDFNFPVGMNDKRKSNLSAMLLSPTNDRWIRCGSAYAHAGRFLLHEWHRQ